MPVHIVRLGTDRLKNEGIRIGTVRRPPRGVAKTDFAVKNWYDTWLPNLSPSAETMKLGQAVQTDRDWKVFEKKYRAEMASPENQRILELLAAMSCHTDFSVGCYCENEARCHRSILKHLLMEKGARIVPAA